jgi:ubiquinone/menaquinone biosynthesis C-methylase UbiE
MAEQVRHPIFARVYERLAGAQARSGEDELRREMLAGISGRVVEVGCGNGLNFPHYPAAVTEVVGVEPEGYLRSRAEQAALEAPVPVTVVAGLAGELPAEDASFDAGVASLVLCSVPDQGLALAELHRVIRPGGELRFYEHVVGESPGFVRFQRAAGKLWPLFAGGCHTDRDTERAISAAGFEIERCRRFAFQPSLVEYPVKPKILGVGRRP